MRDRRRPSTFGERHIRPRKRIFSDHYLYCDQCQTYSKGLCPQGCQTYQANQQVGSLAIDLRKRFLQQADHAEHSVPIGIRIAPSRVLNAGLGAFALACFPEDTFFGPYTGERHRSVERANRSCYAWTIEDAHRRVYDYIDASDPHRSNWLRYVNCPSRQEDENLIAIQFNGELYYRTMREIQPGEELFVYYGEE